MRRCTDGRKLDNAANLFPAVANRQDPHVYRLTAILRDDIKSQILQSALDQILPYFKAFDVNLYNGWFRSRLEANPVIVQVEEETKEPCLFLDPFKTRGALFRILYYNNRIHLEAFHVLTDGTGAMQFIKALCYRYLQLAYPENFTEEELSTRYGIQEADNVLDGYYKNHTWVKSKTYKEPSAYRLVGLKRRPGNLGILTAIIPIQAIKAESKRFAATISEYLVAVIAAGMMLAYNDRNRMNRPINIGVPVNLRPVFQTETALNFFSTITVVLYPTDPLENFDSILNEVKTQFKEKTTKRAFEEKIAFTVGGEKSVFAYITPLSLKNWFLRFMYNHVGDGSTLCFSNLGLNKVEEPFNRYIQGFRVLLAPTPKEPVKITVCGYADELTLTFTSGLENNNLAGRALRLLTESGIPVTLETGGDPYE